MINVFRVARNSVALWLSGSFPRFWGALLAAALAVCLRTNLAGAQSLDEHLWGVDNTISALACAGNVLYVGGTFNRVGPSTGGAVALPKSVDGGRKPFPKVTGYVYTIASDSRGGWFLAGNFTAVGGVPRFSLAHVLGDGSISAWNPNPNRQAYGVYLLGGLVWVTGLFATIAGKSHLYIAALDPETGEATVWNARSNGIVYPMVLEGNTLYVGGYFTEIGGLPRNNIAALDATTGDALPWNPNPLGHVFCGVLRNDRLVVGGDFLQIGGENRSMLAALDLRTGKATEWNPDVRGASGSYVSAMVEHQGRLFIGGFFTTIGGVSRNNLAALNPETGSVLGWNPNPTIVRGSSDVSVLKADGNSVYVGGYFSDIGGEHRNFLAEIDVATGKARPWNPDPSNVTYAIAIDDDAICIGGTFKSMGMIARRNLAAFDLTTGEVTPWNPSPDGLIVYALVVAEGRVYAGGFFDHIGGQPRLDIAALDTLTGAALDWNPGADQVVRTLVTDGSTVYAGGAFRVVGGQSRRYLAAIDAETGVVRPWNPDPNDWVTCLALDQGKLYAGGYFRMVGGLPRSRLADIDAATGAVGEVQVEVNGLVSGLAVSNGTVYAGGSFETVNGGAQLNAFACDAVTGALRQWYPSPNGPRQDGYYASVSVVAARDNTVYLGGDFTTVGGAYRAGLAAVSGESGYALDWSPNPDQSVLALALGNGTVYAGGFLQAAMDEPHAGLFAASEAPQPPLDVEPLVLRPRVELAPIVPNPVRASARIRYFLPREASVNLAVFDMQGRRVQTLMHDELQPAGPHELQASAAELPIGCYVFRLEAAGSVLTQKGVVLR